MLILWQMKWFDLAFFLAQFYILNPNHFDWYFFFLHVSWVELSWVAYNKRLCRPTLFSVYVCNSVDLKKIKNKSRIRFVFGFVGAHPNDMCAIFVCLCDHIQNCWFVGSRIEISRLNCIPWKLNNEHTHKRSTNHLKKRKTEKCSN